MMFQRTVLTLVALMALSSCRDGRASSGSDPATSSPSADTLTVRMIYGSEKQVWIDEATTAFNAQNLQSQTGKRIVVQPVPMGSAEGLQKIVSGEEKPAVWSPASRLLIPILNKRWVAAHEKKLITDSTPLVFSPVVIAMWKPMAQALGWPKKPIGWADIAALGKSGKSWKDFGHPEWGAFQFGHTHPDYSNSGVVSILATVYAAVGKTENLTVADAKKPEAARLLGDLERSVIHYGESTGFFGRQMFNRGPAYLSAAVLYENLVVESYDANKYPNRALPVVAIYPKEGTIWADHPFCVPDAPWVTDELRAAANTYRDFLRSEPQQRRALELGFRPAAAIQTGAPITAQNGVDATQPKTLLQVPNADVLEAVRSLWGRQKKRVEVQVVLDTSGSMADERKLEQAKAALKIFVGKLSDEDYLGVTTFSTSATELTPLSKLGSKRSAVLERIAGLFPSGKTRLIDTASEAYRALTGLPSSDRIRAVVLLTDGEDTSSEGHADDLVSLLGKDESGQGVKVFTIAYGSGANADVLKSIADASGAKSYASDPAKIEQVYRDIATFF